MITVKLSCQKCGGNFDWSPKTYDVLGFRELPKQCPKCIDERQGRPLEAVALSRRCLLVWEAVKNCLPTELFEPYQAPGASRACLRAVVKGEMLNCGVSWQGRIDIYCLASTLPQIARMRLMNVTHAAGHKRIERHGEVMGKKEVLEVSYPADYTYLVLEPAEPEASPTAALVFPKVSWKWTFKGFGRQYYASLETDCAIWAVRLSSSARSGRFGCYAAIAIVDDNHPVVARQTGDFQSTRYFTFSHPYGCEESEYCSSASSVTLPENNK